MEKKITKKELFGMLLAIEEVSQSQILVDFINHELELLQKKSEKSSTSKQKKENEIIQNQLLADLALLSEPVTVDEFRKESAYVIENGFSNQKVSAMFKALIEKGLVEKTVVKGKSYFSVK